MPFYESDGLRMGYGDVGEGPALVLIHGWAEARQEWEAAGWAEGVGRGRRLLIPDVRGHGTSARPHELAAYATRALAHDILALLDAAEIRQADVIGYSMGSAIALWAVALWPDRVRSLVAGGVPPEDAAERVVIGRALRDEAAMTVRAAEYRDWALRLPGNDLDALGLCLEAGCTPPPCAELALFGGEALLAAGTADSRFEATQETATCLPGGRFLALAGADHMGAFRDARFRSAVVGFLEEVSPR